MWGFLAGTVLHPMAAAVYLVALLLTYPAYRLMAPAPRTLGPPSAASVPPAIQLFGEISYRGATGDVGPAPPVEIPAPSRGVVLLAVHSDLDAEDLSGSGARFRAVLLDGDTVVWSVQRSVSDLSPGGVLPILLDPERMSPGKTYVLELRGAPGGEVLFRRSFRIVANRPDRAAG